MESITQFRELADFIQDVEADDAVNYQDKIVVVALSNMAEAKASRMITPMQLNALAILVVTAGELRITIDYKPYVVRKNMLYMLMERHIINDISASEDFRGYHIVVEHDFFKKSHGEEKPPLGMVFNVGRNDPVIKPEERDFEMLIEGIQKLIYDMQKAEHSYHSKMIQNGLANLTFDIWDMMKQKSDMSESALKQNVYDEITVRFFDLLFKHHKKEHEVSFYADQLNITPIYLSRAIKQITGKPTIKIISDVVLMEAKISLRNPQMNIQQIADNLNFSDQASFSKFFKKHTGESPMEYRKSLS